VSGSRLTGQRPKEYAESLPSHIELQPISTKFGLYLPSQPDL
jgi:hypothetical protein